VLAGSLAELLFRSAFPLAHPSRIVRRSTREGRAGSPGETPARLALAINPERGKVDGDRQPPLTSPGRSPRFSEAFLTARQDSALRPLAARTRARGPDTAGFTIYDRDFSALDRGKWRDRRGTNGEGQEGGGGKKTTARSGAGRPSRGGLALLVKFGIWHNRRHSGPPLRPSPSCERALGIASPPRPRDASAPGFGGLRELLEFRCSALSNVKRCRTNVFIRLSSALRPLRFTRKGEESATAPVVRRTRGRVALRWLQVAISREFSSMKRGPPRCLDLSSNNNPARR